MGQFLGWKTYDLPKIEHEAIEWRLARIKNIRNGLIPDATEESVQALIEELKIEFNYEYKDEEHN